MKVITRALEYYDKNRETYDNFFSKIKYVKQTNQNNKDLERSKIIFYDKNNKEMGRSRYEKIGIYNVSSKIWTWSWAVAINPKNTTYLARKILNYGLDITVDDNKHNNLFLKSELTTSRFKIDHAIQLDIHIAICSYIAKIPMILPSSHKDDINVRDYGEFDYKPGNISKSGIIQTEYFFILDHDKLNI
jgi:hypothetical protein